ncbi:hypothetical protein IFM89_000069 [Coptis chinensis]|uniref:AMP-dependent synthetase/ligase domain-containing protein n=1 Tax=Coptis chinensis TaxID=261450 RepID=A0A835IFP2_9MAGN|nr:hypothetical protein IFM89_000069 [Coptis chinensis]
MPSVYTVQVEEARQSIGERPSAGPVYRCIFAKDGLLELPTGLESPWELFSHSVEKNPRNQMLGHREVVNGKGGRCGIFGTNCPEWIISMEACNSHGIQYVPLYDTLGANAVEFIINHAEVSIAFVQENKIQAMLTCLPRCKYLKTIVSFGKIADAQMKEAEEIGVSCFSWKEFASLGTPDDKLSTRTKSDICTIMYTSGTTGEPKADRRRLLFFIPSLAHVFDQIMETYCIYRDVRYLMEDLQELKPTMFSWGSPDFDRIYTGTQEKISAGGTLKKIMYQYAYNYKLKNLEAGLKQEEAAPLFDKLVFNKIKQVLGGRVRIIISGAAPLSTHVEEFLRVTSCSILSQGYGLTESCGGCFTSIANVFSMIGTVGVPGLTIEARLESVPEMGYDALSTVPRGEICLRGKTLFTGYHKRPDLTEEVVVDGWFHTGDIGEWQANGVMKIIDRRKNIFKLSQGEYVAVEKLENTFGQCPLITAIWVYGNSFESFLVAVVVPDRKALDDWAAAHHENGEFRSMCENPKARKYILDELNSTGQKQKIKGFEMLRAVHLEPIPFDFERDLITPTFKLKRPQLLKYYKDRIDQLYSEAKKTKA